MAEAREQFGTKKQQKITIWHAVGRHMADDNGLLVAAIRTSLFAPLTTMKIRLQTQDALQSVRIGAEQPYTGWIQQCKRLPDRFGWLHFWRGNLVYLAARAATSVLDVFFGVWVNASLQASSLGATDAGRDAALMVAAVSSGALTTVAFYPAEVYRTRVTMDPSWSFLGALHSPRGFLCLYDGFLPYVISIASHRLLSLLTLNAVLPRNTKRARRYWQYVVTTLVAFGLSYPFEVVSRRLQLQSTDPIGEQVYSGMIDCFRKMVRTEGWASLYHGFAFNVVWLLFPTPPAAQS